MKLHSFLALACLTIAAQAAPETFDFKDPKGVNNAAFKLDAPLEAVSGNASGISGTVTFDPDQPGATEGKILIASSTLTVPNPMQQQHMHSTNWLDVAKNPQISFASKKFNHVKTEGNVTTADVAGVFTLKGISKDITVPVKMTFLKDKLSARVPNLKGDLLVIRGNFAISRKDFNLMPGQFEDKVSDTIEISLSIAGMSPH